MDQRVQLRAAHRCAARSAHPPRPYPRDEWRQLQAQSEQAPITARQLGPARGQSDPSLMPDEKGPQFGGLLPASLMHFCSDKPMHFCSGVDTQPITTDCGASMAKARKKRQPFNVDVFLNTVAGGRSVSNYRKHQKVFSQGEPGDSVFYIQEGKVKVCVVSEQRKEAVVALHGNGDFFGEGCLNGHPLRMATVVTMTECVIMRLEKA